MVMLINSDGKMKKKGAGGIYKLAFCSWLGASKVKYLKNGILDDHYANCSN